MALEREDLELIARTLITPLIERMEVGFEALRAETRTGLAAVRTEAQTGVEALRLETRTGFDRLDTRLAHVDEGIARLDTGLSRLEIRIDQVVLNTGAHWRDHERRLQRIELSLRANGHGTSDDEEDEEEE